MKNNYYKSIICSIIFIVFLSFVYDPSRAMAEVDSSNTSAQASSSDDDSSADTSQQATSSDDDSNADTSKQATSSDDDSSTDTSKQANSSDDNSNADTSKQATSSDDDSNADTSKQATSSDDNSNADTSKQATSSDDNSNADTSKQASSSDDNSSADTSKQATSSDDDSNADTSKQATSSDDNSNADTSKQATAKINTNTDVIAGKTSVIDIMPKTSSVIGKFNIAIYQMFINPFATVYKKVVPAIVDQKLNDVLDWSYGPYYMVNDILRFDMTKLANNTGSFLINGTVGVLGIFDISSSFNINQSQDDLLGTLHTWGLQDRYYMQLPLVGPQTELTLVSLLTSTLIKPTTWLSNSTIIDPGKTLFDNAIYTRNILHYMSIGIDVSKGLTILKKVPGDKQIIMRDAWLSLHKLYVKGKSAYDLDLDDESDEFGESDF